MNQIEKRARRKYLTSAFILHMLNEIPESEMKKSYWNTFHCTRTAFKEITPDGVKFKSKYCMNRFCLTCAAVKTAHLIAGYKSILDTWQDKKFLTLTIPNVPHSVLNESIKEMHTQIRKIFDTSRRHRVKILAVRKFEITYNSETDTYHPHFHYIVDTLPNAVFILNQWLERFPDSRPIAQEIRSCDENYIELFKYFTKIISRKYEKVIATNPHALDIIFTAVSGRRTVQNHGFKCNPKIAKEKFDEAAFGLLEKFNWDQQIHDWINYLTGEVASNYTPTDVIENLVSQYQKGRTRCQNEKSEQLVY